MKRYVKYTMFSVLSLLFFSSCRQVKDIAYFQKPDSQYLEDWNSGANNSTVTNINGIYEAKIKPKDLLSISVVSSEPEASKMYNLIVPQVAKTINQSSLYSEPTLQTYLVDNMGFIEFPVFGKIKVGGLTSNEFETVLLKKLAPAFTVETPIITIRITNYFVNVLGEVQQPGRFETANSRITIFEGLALAGDMTIYGRRDNVTVLRENNNGTKEFITVDLNDRNIIYSPAYYLEQNDVVYVEPNKSRSRSSKFGEAENFGISSLSVLLTLTSIVLTVFR